MKVSNLTTSKIGYVLKGMIINEARTVLIGKVQDKDQLRGEDEPIVFISTKWDIDRENKICVCQLGIPEYDISLENKYIPGLLDPEKPKKNFYTFKKDAWHCKFYKWIFGKEPHKVHPTMCPYFWIMVVVFLTLPIILAVKLTGKAGVKFMDSCVTYSRRQREKRIATFVKYCENNLEKMTDEAAYKLVHSKLFKAYEYELQYKVRYAIEDKSSAWSRLKRHEAELENDRIAEEREASRAIRDAARQKTMMRKKANVEIRDVQIKEFKESKTSKIIGIGLVIIFSGLALWGISVAAVGVFMWINWKWVGYGILGIISFAAVCYVIYASFKYIIIPTFKWIYLQLSKINLPKPPKLRLGKKIKKSASFTAKVFAFLFGWVPRLWRIIVQSIVYTVDFFGMIRDLIHSMYKKNCPVITWVDEDEK
jgi:ABC-type multidrug transport system fused ATPase/permease subunit